MVEPLKKDDITNTFEIWKDLQKQWKEHCGIGDTKYYIEVSRIKELLRDVLNFAVITNDKIELQCKIINTFSILFDNGNEDRGMRNDEEISCDTGNTNAGLKSLTKDGSVQPMTSRPDVHEASSQDSPAVPTQSPPSMTNKDKPSQKQLGNITKKLVGVSFNNMRTFCLDCGCPPIEHYTDGTGCSYHNCQCKGWR